MRRGKAKDRAGIAADMFKDGGEKLAEVLLHVFNDVIKTDREPPSSWRRSSITVLFKDGDPALPSNYRPIVLIL
eukprot:10503552-Karenia_brevis.AAC.1